MWAIGWWLCGRAITRFQLPPAQHWQMGLAFLILLLALEQLPGLTLLGRSPAQQWAAYSALPAQLGLIAQVMTASFPLWPRRR